MAENSAPVLSYATKQPWHQRRWIRRSFRILLVLAGVALLWLVAPPAWRRVQIEYYFRQCNKYAQPPNFVVRETDHAQVARLLALDPQYRNQVVNDVNADPHVAAWMPDNWAKLSRLMAPDLTAKAYNWRDFPPMVFMHELTAPGGAKALVVVRYMDVSTWTGPPLYRSNDFYVFIVPPSAKSVRDFEGGFTRIYEDRPQIRWTASPTIVRIYAGQTVPADPAALTFDIETDAGRQTLHGRLESLHQLTIEGVPMYR